MNGRAIKSCSIVAMQAEGADIMTIEGVAKPDGTCTMQAGVQGEPRPAVRLLHPRHGDERARLRGHPNPTEQEVREALEGNLCRCTGYHNIVKSIIAGARAMGGKI